MSDTTKYLVKRRIINLLGAVVRTYDTSNQLVCKAHQKAFKLREEINFYRDEEQTSVLFRVKARKIIDLGATYDIFDPAHQRLASLRRRGLQSTFVRDEWVLMDADEQEIGQLVEDSHGLAIIRRYLDFVSLFLPQRFHIMINNKIVATIQQNKNPFTVRLSCEYLPEAKAALGDILPIAIPNLVALLEGRQG